MTDIEISKALALAIGWTEDRFDESGDLDPDIALFGGSGQEDEIKVWFDGNWCTFNYRDPTVIWPIAERYNCWPVKLGENYWVTWWKTASNPSIGSQTFTADTAAKVVALAVIDIHAPK